MAQKYYLVRQVADQIQSNANRWAEYYNKGESDMQRGTSSGACGNTPISEEQVAAEAAAIIAINKELSKLPDMESARRVMSMVRSQMNMGRGDY